MTDIVPVNAVESALIGGDLAKLTPEQRVMYYRQVCQSLGLNPLTKPFDYINLNGKLTLYARKDATDQLRNLKNISIGKPDIQFQDDWIIVTVIASDNTGRSDSDVGVVNKKDMRGDFGNALMKAVTKAKRRVTLSICGLGMLDETEVETIPDARKTVTIDADMPLLEQPTTTTPTMTLEEAIAIQNSEGVPYGEIDSETLGYMSKSIGKALANNHLTPEQKAEYQRKQAAIGVILQASSKS